MEIINIPGLNRHAAENYAAAEKRKPFAPGKQEDKEEAPKNKLGAQPEDIHDFSRLRPEVLADYHGLRLEEARTLLGEVAPEIINLNPWSLAELQPVVDRSLIPSAYV